MIPIYQTNSLIRCVRPWPRFHARQGSAQHRFMQADAPAW
jgi:hypothetical protein